MKHLFLPILFGLLLLSSCDREEAAAGESERPVSLGKPDAEVVAALRAQSFGKNLLGKTRLLVDGKLVPAELRKAPDYYLVHFSASW